MGKKYGWKERKNERNRNGASWDRRVQSRDSQRCGSQDVVVRDQSFKNGDLRGLDLRMKGKRKEKHRNRKWKKVRQADRNRITGRKRLTEVTVIIPNYEGKDYVEACLDSLCRGSLVPEIIVVDNGSGDGSAELIEKWMDRRSRKNLPSCRLIRFPENRGFCAAVNAGIRLAETEYVILLNNDTEVDRDFVRNLCQAIEKRKNAFSVSAKVLSLRQPEIIDDAGDLYCVLGWAFALGKGKGRTAYRKAAKIFAACACAAVYRKSVFETIGYFDENHFAYLEDIDIGYRAEIYGYENYYTPDAIVYHAGSAVSGSRYNEFKVRLTSRNSIYLAYKNMPWFQILLNFPFLAAGIGIKALFFIKKGLGKAYAKGLFEGIGLILSRKGRERKVPFRSEYLGNYGRIQIELWINMVRRFTG